MRPRNMRQGDRCSPELLCSPSRCSAKTDAPDVILCSGTDSRRWLAPKHDWDEADLRGKSRGLRVWPGIEQATCRRRQIHDEFDHGIAGPRLSRRRSHNEAAVRESRRRNHGNAVSDIAPGLLLSYSRDQGRWVQDCFNGRRNAAKWPRPHFKEFGSSARLTDGFLWRNRNG